MKKMSKAMSKNIKVNSRSLRINKLLKNNNLKVSFSAIYLTSKRIHPKILLFLKKLKHSQKKVQNALMIAILRGKFKNWEI